MLRIKRTYDRPARGDGRRILVERLWPRGLTKEGVAADLWIKDVAPSTELRKWFDHREERWEEFRRRYRNELDAVPRAWEPILKAARRGAVTLLYSAHDTFHNGALALRDYLAERDAESRQHGGISGAGAPQERPAKSPRGARGRTRHGTRRRTR
jgi:uncharacterized protein YeaO (DUF488 family)